jgi:mono/diheme cytochrome c family protein
MRKSYSISSLVLVVAIAIILGGCAAKGDNPGREYAPNMYHSVAYEPLSQITDETAGSLVNALDARQGEFFNSNKYNPNRMNMREPAPNTVKRNQYGFLPYRKRTVPKDSIPLITAGMMSPLDSSAAVVADGKLLYTMYCQHCHGAKGEGDGKVADKYPGVANLRGIFGYYRRPYFPRDHKRRWPDAAPWLAGERDGSLEDCPIHQDHITEIKLPRYQFQLCTNRTQFQKNASSLQPGPANGSSLWV